MRGLRSTCQPACRVIVNDADDDQVMATAVEDRAELIFVWHRKQSCPFAPIRALPQ